MKKYNLSGKINVGCLFLIILLIAVGYVGFKFGKVYLAKYLLSRTIFEIAGDVAKDPDSKIFPDEIAITEAIIEEAKKLSADISYDNIWVKRDEQSVAINVTWEGDIVLPQYTHHFIFEFKTKREIFY